MSTTPTTADPLVSLKSSPAPASGPVVPTIDEIERLAPEERRVFRGVDWAFYRQVVDVLWGRREFRLTFDGRDLEIMAIGGNHEAVDAFAWRLVELVTEELDITMMSLGKTTWMRPEIERGLEADQCFFFLPEKLEAIAAAIARLSGEIADYPNPDLAIEVDISPPKVDRPSIYAALKVTEVWRFNASSVIIERLTDQGIYAVSETSGFLPIRADEIARWVLQEDRSNLLAWKRRLRAWVRAELSDRRPD